MSKKFYMFYATISLITVNLLPAIPEIGQCTNTSMLHAICMGENGLLCTENHILEISGLLSGFFGCILTIVGAYFNNNWLRRSGALWALLLPITILSQFSKTPELSLNIGYYLITAILTLLALISFVQFRDNE